MSHAAANRAVKEPRQADIIARLREHVDEIRGQGIISLAIFGSRPRGDARLDSDLDVLVDYDPTRPFTLYDLVRLERLLEDFTGFHVHVSTRDGFSPEQLRRILTGSISVL